MKNTILFAICLFACSCGIFKKKQEEAKPCTTAKTETGIIISCPDGSITNIDNAKSCSVKSTAQGSKLECPDGSWSMIYNGAVGSSCSVIGTSSGAQISCDDGTNATLADGKSGDKGETGQSGTNGLAGQNGINCVLEQLANGVKINCGDSIGYIYNGIDGQPGQDAPASAYSLQKYITPCGPNSSPWKEVLLCMGDGNILASFSENADGKNTRLALIPPGDYIDTDASNCHFSVTTQDGNSVVSWNGGSAICEGI